jgi:hypothetical protein
VAPVPRRSADGDSGCPVVLGVCPNYQDGETFPPVGDGQRLAGEDRFWLPAGAGLTVHADRDAA